MKNIFKANLISLLHDKNVESIPLKNINVLSFLINEDDIFDKMYNLFQKEFISSFKIDDLYMKSEDFIYRLNLLVNEYIIPNYGYVDNYQIKYKLEKLIDAGVDLYSAVSYDDTDIIVLEEFYEFDSRKDLRV